MNFKCNFCNKILKQPGALLFSPPMDYIGDNVIKYHICVDCYCELIKDKIK